MPEFVVCRRHALVLSCTACEARFTALRFQDPQFLAATEKDENLSIRDRAKQWSLLLGLEEMGMSLGVIMLSRPARTSAPIRQHTTTSVNIQPPPGSPVVAIEFLKMPLSKLLHMRAGHSRAEQREMCCT